ncbi:hypothetical protein HCN44_007221 [Aphidius gifuensis]|uniref:BEN domain-containing protein n=1 Tax=Aphidius gifuensis TaxID=684658 RepID=A0A834XMW8_APHGI|nr:hypothetical protein HCN44_007221 [Aphidius gifuensis]
MDNLKTSSSEYGHLDCINYNNAYKPTLVEFCNPEYCDKIMLKDEQAGRKVTVIKAPEKWIEAHMNEKRIDEQIKRMENGLLSAKINENSTSTMSLSNNLPQPGPSAQKENGSFSLEITQNSNSDYEFNDELTQLETTVQKEKGLFLTNINQNSTSTLLLSNKLPQSGPSTQKENGLLSANFNQHSTSTMSLSNKLPQPGPSAQKENGSFSLEINQNSNSNNEFHNKLTQLETIVRKEKGLFLTNINQNSTSTLSLSKKLPQSGPSTQKENGLLSANFNQHSTSTMSLSNKLPQPGPNAQKINDPEIRVIMQQPLPTNEISNNSLREEIIDERWIHLHGMVYVSASKLRYLELSKTDPAKSASYQLISMLVPEKVLQTHSLTGKPSPAFPNKQPLPKIDPRLITAIIRKYNYKYI